MRRRLAEFLESGAVLDRYYIPTRYPNGLPDLTPGKVYFQKDASVCIGAAQRLLERVEREHGHILTWRARSQNHGEHEEKNGTLENVTKTYGIRCQ